MAHQKRSQTPRLTVLPQLQVTILLRAGNGDRNHLDRLEMKTISLVLLVIGIIAYIVLWLLLLTRLVLFFPRIKADINDHVRGPGFFTVVAGTCVLGSALIIVTDQYRIAAVLWLAGIFLWTLIMYTFVAAMTVRENKPSIEGGLNGGFRYALLERQLAKACCNVHKSVGSRASLRSLPIYLPRSTFLQR
jgi:hypothetical protein